MTTEVEIIHEPERDRFTVTVGGSEAGFAQYREKPGEIAFVHTETDPAQQGRGLASQLIAHALQDARRRNLTVLPYCSFVRDYIAAHREHSSSFPRPNAPASDSDARAPCRSEMRQETPAPA